MKKVVLGLILPILAVTLLAGCSSPTDSTETSSEDVTSGAVEEVAEADEVEEEDVDDSNQHYGMGDRAVVDGIAYTLQSVTLVDERNEWADTDPEYVIKVEYLFENETDEEQYAGWDLSVYDSSGHTADTYPLDVSGAEVAAGKQTTVVEYYGLDVLGETEFHFSPMVSFSSAAVFTVEVK